MTDPNANPKEETMSNRSEPGHPARCTEAFLPPRMRRATTLLVLGALAGCGNLTAGGIGEASVAMSGDAPDDASSPQMAVVSDPTSESLDLLGGALADSDDNPEGEVEAELSVFLVAEDGTAIPLTDGDVRVRVDLKGVEEPEIGSRRVSAGTYAALRMVFTEIEAEVSDGLIINGQPVVGIIDVEIEHVNLVVERSLNLDIPDGGRVELVIDLNSEDWLQAVDLLTVPPSVDAQVFADLVTVRVR